MYFNKEGQPSLTEIVKEQKQLPQNFPIDTFLQMYNEWNKIPNNSSIDERINTRQSLFAKLRDLHQQYGVNTNKGLDFWNAEEEMHAFAKYLNKIKDNRSETQQILSNARDKISQKSAEVININGQEIRKGDTVILNEENATFTGNYKVDVNSKIIEIEIIINGQPGYAQLKDVVFFEKGKPTNSIVPERATLRYTFDVYKGFAEQELKKHDKTIHDLQKLLKEKKHYTGEINRVFDQATLDAVLAFQKTIPNAKYGADGLVGSEETIPALFGIQPSPNTPKHEKKSPKGTPTLTRRTDGEPESPRRPVEPNSPAEPHRDKNEKVSGNMGALAKAMQSFHSVYKAVHDETNTILPDHEKDIERRNKALGSAIKPVIEQLNAINPKTLNEQNRKTYEIFKLEVAKYYANELSGIRSRQYADYPGAFELAASIVLPELKGKVSFPTAPTDADIEKNLQVNNNSLYQRYKDALSRGWTRGQFLSNPKIRAEWADVQEKLVGEYETKMQKALGSIDEKSALLKTSEQYEALKLMKTIMGSDGWFDFKKRNLDNWIQTGGAIGSAIVGGIAGVGLIASTPLTGVGAVAGASVIGATITTVGGTIARGRYDEKYLLTESAINLVTIGAAGAVGKLAKARYIDKGRAIAGYSLDGATGLALGVTGEYTRALSDGANLGDLSHWKMIAMQLPWALLPMTMGGLGHLKGRAQNVQDTLSTAQSQKNMGLHTEADATLKKIQPEVNALAQEGKTAVSKQAEQKAILPEETIGSKVQKPVNESVAPSAKNEGGVSKPQQTNIGQVETVSNMDGYESFYKSLVPKIDKKNFPVGTTIESQGLKITAEKGDTYLVNYNGKEYRFDTHDDISHGLSKIIKTDEERLAFLQSTSSVRMAKHMYSFDGKFIGENQNLRWKYDGNGKLKIQKKDPETGAWEYIESQKLSPAELNTANANFFGVSPKQYSEAIKKAEGASIHDAVSESWLQGIAGKYGTKAKEGIASGFNKAKEKSLSTSKFLGWEMPKGILSFFTGIGSRNISLTRAMVYGAIVEGVDDLINPSEQFSYKDLMKGERWGEIGEFLFRVVAFRYMGLISGSGLITIQNLITGGYRVKYGPESNGAQVPSPEKSTPSAGDVTSSLPDSGQQVSSDK